MDIAKGLAAGDILIYFFLNALGFGVLFVCRRIDYCLCMKVVVVLLR